MKLPATIAQVILAVFEANGHRWELSWFRPRPGSTQQFRVMDRHTEEQCSFSDYRTARAIFDLCCEQAGQPTFRSEATQRGVS